MPVNLEDLKGSIIVEPVKRNKNQVKIQKALESDPTIAYSLKELQEVAGVKYPSATRTAVMALKKKGLIESFLYAGITHYHWIGNADSIIVTESKEYLNEEDV